MSKVRLAETGDIEELVRLNGIVQALHARLHPELFKTQADPSELARLFSERIANALHVIAVYRDGDETKGYVWFELQDAPETAFTYSSKRIYIHHLSVTCSAQRQGIGRQLLDWVEAYAASRGIRQILVDHWAANAAADAFFSRSGYAPLRKILLKDTIESGTINRDQG